MKRKLAIVFFFIAIVAAGFIIYLVYPLYDRIPFSSESWLKGNIRERGKMTRDLLEQNVIIGRMRPEVSSILGIPDDTLLNNWRYTVDLGYRFGSSPWTYSLFVIFDSTSNKVQTAYTGD